MLNCLQYNSLYKEQWDHAKSNRIVQRTTEYHARREFMMKTAGWALRPAPINALPEELEWGRERCEACRLE